VVIILHHMALKEIFCWHKMYNFSGANFLQQMFDSVGLIIRIENFRFFVLLNTATIKVIIFMAFFNARHSWVHDTESEHNNIK